MLYDRNIGRMRIGIRRIMEESVLAKMEARGAWNAKWWSLSSLIDDILKFRSHICGMSEDDIVWEDCGLCR
jgi:hypothetical protein